jgi:hypothetical protein
LSAGAPVPSQLHLQRDRLHPLPQHHHRHPQHGHSQLPRHLHCRPVQSGNYRLHPSLNIITVTLNTDTVNFLGISIVPVQSGNNCLHPSLNIITVTLNMDTVNFFGISIVGQSNQVLPSPSVPQHHHCNTQYGHSQLPRHLHCRPVQSGNYCLHPYFNIITVALNMDTVNFLGISIVGQSNQVLPSPSVLNIITVTLNMDIVNFLGISIVGQSNQVINVSIRTSTSSP